MNDVRLFLAELILFVAWAVCPKALRYHIKTAADFVHEDHITNLCAGGE